MFEVQVMHIFLSFLSFGTGVSDDKHMRFGIGLLHQMPFLMQHSRFTQAWDLQLGIH